MKKTVLILSALAALAACNKAEDNIAPVKEGIIMTCTFADPDTKAVSDDGVFTWAAGEGIFVHDSRHSDQIILGADDISSDGKTATITLTNADPANDDQYKDGDGNGYLFAFYPLSAIKTDSRTSNLYYLAEYSNPNVPIAAARTSTGSFDFVNVCGGVSFTVDASADVDGYLLVSNSGVKFYSNLEIRFKPDDSAPRAYTYDNNSIKEADSIEGALVPGETTFVWMPFGEVLSGGITIFFTKDGEKKSFVSSSTDLTVARGHIAAFGNLTSKLKPYVPPTSHDSSIPVSGAADLGADGTANCYIVDGSVAANAGKIFKFKAVKGNGTAVLETIDGVQILWETWNSGEEVTANSVIAAVDYDLQEDEDPYIVFQMPSELHAGNALIAAKSGSTIIWSWHIWVPETSIATSTYGGIIGSPMMDRNLGAVIVAEEAPKNIKSYGFYYQWGRKDPFFPSKFKSAGTPISFSGSLVETAEESVAEPTVYINTGSDDVKDWNTEGNTSLWYKNKSVYDPCPPGYMVPTRDKTFPFWSGLASATGWTANTEEGWFKAGVAYDADNAGTTGYAVFPYTGYIDLGSLTHEADRVYIWSSYTSSSNLAYQVYVSGSSASTTEQRRSRAGSIRCVAE